jgi:hypothetical protein
MLCSVTAAGVEHVCGLDSRLWPFLPSLESGSLARAATWAAIWATAGTHYA